MGSSTGDNGTTNYTVPSIAYGTSVNLVAPATDPAGYTFSKWTVNGTALTAGLKNVTFTMPAAATTAVAQYTTNTYTLTVQSTPPTGLSIGSSTGASGTTNYTVSNVGYGTGVNLVAPATDPTGYTFSQWTVSGVAQTAGLKSITFTMPAAATTAVAQYTLNTYALTVQSTPPTGAVITSSTPDGGTTNYTVSSVGYNTSVNLVAPATDPAGYTFSKWTVNGTALTAGLKNVTFTMPAAATTAVAQYTTNTYTLTVQSTSPTGLSIGSSTGHSGTTNYTVSNVGYGTGVNLVAPATDPTGYTFSKWTVNGTAQTAGLKSITFTMTGVTTAAALYTTNTYALTVQSTPPTGIVITSTSADGGTTNYTVSSVAYGTSVKLTAPATDPAGYTFSQWMVNGTAQTAGLKSITFTMPAAATTAAAQYTLNTYTLTVQSTPPTGLSMGSSTGDGGTTNYTVSNVGYGTSVNLVAPATDPTGYTFSQWTVSGVAQTAGLKSITFTMPAAATTAVAQYTTNTYALTVQSTPPTGIVITSTSADGGTTNYTVSSVAYGTSVKLTAPATDPAGYTFSQWTVNGTAQTAGLKSITFTMPAAATTAAAQYTLNTYTLTVQSTPPTGLSMGSSTGDNGTTNYTVPSIAYGTSVNLVAPATDPTGYTFAKWTVNGTAQTAGLKSITFTMTAATTAAAQYTLNTYALTVQSTPPTGVVITSSSADGGTTNYTVSSVGYNTSVNLVAPATDPTGYTFSQWTVNGVAQTAGLKSITFTMPAAALTATAQYIPGIYTLTVQSTPPTGLSIGSSGADGGTTNYAIPGVAYETSVNLVAPATDPTGYTFSKWTVNGTAQTAGLKSITFTMTGVTTAAALYTTNTYALTVQSTPPTAVVITSSSADGGTTNYTVSSVAYGASVNLVAPATDPTGYTFSQWTVNGVAQTAGLKSITFTMPATAMTAEAQYIPGIYTLTVQSTPPTGLSIGSSGADGGTTNYTVTGVAYETSVNLVAPATDPTGYTFSKWTVNGTAQTAGLKSITFTMTGVTTAAALYTTNTYALTVQSTPLTAVVITSSSADGGTTNYTVSSVAYGASVNLVAPATDPTGYTFLQWTVNGAAQTAGLKSITFTMTGATTAAAQYTLNTYTLTVQSTPLTALSIGSTTGDDGMTNYSVSGVGYGTSVNLAAPATDPAGYTFSKWTVNGTAQTAGLKSITFAMPAAAATATAQYTLNTYTLTVQSTPLTGVVITSSGADGGTTNYTVPNVGYGTSVDLVAPATDPTGYTFSQWTVNSVAQTSGLKEITFTIAAATTAVAQYTLNTYALTVQSTPPTGLSIGSSTGDNGTTNYTVSSVGYGTSVNLAAPATDPAGYTFSKWTVNGTAQTAGLKSITFAMPAAAATAAAQYTLNTFTLTVQSTPQTGIVITSSSGDGGTTNYTVSSIGYGTSVDLVAPATDPTGYTFSQWTLNSVAQTSGLKEITFTMTAATTAVAQYTLNTYALTVQSTPPTGIVITSTSADGGTTNYTMSSVGYGASVKLAAPATNPAGYTFWQWTINGTAQTAGLKNITFTMPATATTATAEYTLNTYTLTVQSTPLTGLSIGSSTGNNGTTNYTNTVAYGTSVNLQAPATDPTGYTFSQWTVSGTAQTAGLKSITFTMTAGTTATAAYTLNSYPLTVQSTPPTGVVITSSSGEGGKTNYTVSSVAYGTSITLVAPATDPTGYTFSQWTVNGTAQTAGLKSITFTMPAGATTAVAQYIAGTYTLTVQSTPPTGVLITSSGAYGGTTNYTVTGVAYETSVNLAAPATDPTGYTFSKWTVNGTAQTAGLKSITFTMTAATTASAVYTLNTYALSVQSTPPTGVTITSSGADGGKTNYTMSSVAYNTSVNLVAPATDPTGYTFSQWTVNGTAQTAGLKSITFTMPATAVTAVAQYMPGIYMLTVQSTPPTGLSIGSSGADGGTTNYTVSSVAYQTSVNLAAPVTDPTGYTFSKWTVNGTAQTAGLKSITFTMTAATTAVAQYTPAIYTLTVQSTPPTGVVITSSSGEGGKTNYTVSSVGYGTSVNLVAPATDPTGYTFSQWTLNSVAQTSGLKAITFTMTAATTAVAQYTLNTFTLTVQSTPPTGVAIGSSSGDGWTTNYTISSVGYGTSVNLAAPATDPAGYMFSEWTVNGTAKTAGLKSISFTMTAAVTAVAQYTPVYPLSVQSTPMTGLGIGSNSGDGWTTNYTMSSVLSGTSVNLAAPAMDPAGYTFSQWTVNGTAQTGGLKSITFTMTAAVTAVAQYTTNVYPLAVQSATPTGIVITSSSADGGTTNYVISGVAYGTSVNLAAPATDPTGYTFSQWTVNGAAQTAGLKSITFTMGANTAGLYILDGYGSVHPVGNAPAFTGGPYWPGMDIARALKVVFDSTGPVQGYYVLDGYGGVHPVGNVPAFTGGPYWPGVNIAQDMDVVYDSTGTVQGYYILDGYGGVHPVGNVPTFTGGPYWAGFDIARALEVVYNSAGTVQGYYILDGYGSVHPVGNVPAFSGGPYWPGFDIARALKVVFDSTGTVQGYYIMDGYGGIHPMGNVPSFSGGPYWPGWDIAVDMGLVYNSTGTVQGYYVLDGYGGAHPVGNVAAVSGGPYWSGFDIARALCVNRTTATTAVAQYLANSYYTLTVQSTPPTGLGIGSSTGNSGTTNYSTQASVAPGTSVNLQAPATDPTGYSFSQWTVNGAAQTAGQKAITFTIAADTTAVAQYSTLVGRTDALPADMPPAAQSTPNSGCTLTVQSAPPTRTLITSSTADGGMTNYTVSSVESGTSVTLQAPATDPVGYTFSQWTLNGAAQTTGQKAITFTVSSDTTAVAQYTANTYTLAVQSTLAAGVVITSSTACGGTTNYTVAGITYGTVVNLAAPATDPVGYTFSQWTLTGGQQPIAFTTSADLKSITFAMSADITAQAVYVKDAP
jgi:hypothetical protein